MALHLLCSHQERRDSKERRLHRQESRRVIPDDLTEFPRTVLLPHQEKRLQDSQHCQRYFL